MNRSEARIFFEMGQRNFEKCQPLWRADKGSSKKSTKNDSIEFRKQKKKKKDKMEIKF